MIETGHNQNIVGMGLYNKPKFAAMTPAHLKFNNTSYMDSVKDTQADTEGLSRTNADYSLMNPDSPVRYGGKRGKPYGSVFKGSKIIERNERMARINELAERQSGGKSYLRQRTLQKGCPHLVKMVEKHTERKNLESLLQISKRKSPTFFSDNIMKNKTKL